MKSKNYILLGPPGSGKSTQAEHLRRALGLVHIDMGSELRAAAEENSALGHELNDIVNRKRELVPDTIVGEILSRAFAAVSETSGILLDGAPRRESQIGIVLSKLADHERTLSGAFFLDLSEKESIARISKRALCFGCHRPYILGKDIEAIGVPCPRCGGKIGQRKDDTPEGVKKRFQIFHEETLPVINYFEKEGLLFRIPADHGADQVSSLICEAISIKYTKEEE